MFQIYQYLGSFKLTEMTEIMTGYFFTAAFIFTNGTKSVHLEIWLAFVEARWFFVEYSSIWLVRENISLWVFSNFLQWMIWVFNDIIATVCEPHKHITIGTVIPSKFKVNNRNSRKSYEIYSKLTIKIPEWCQLRRLSFFIVSLKHISHHFLVFTVDFEQ